MLKERPSVEASLVICYRPFAEGGLLTVDPSSLEIIRNVLLSDGDDVEDIDLDEIDADEEEHISEREDD
ncbi:hypothetical protein NPIL_555711 [Nephila pilipes]|uniref:Uncharacterized protein n=1 Tax=Nephila pilipes TaxID=299642 RepID=A0A8X6T3A4_NEPPI|nr:hypothetical protein NPIL_555711 [Nephila pilipes]